MMNRLLIGMLFGLISGGLAAGLINLPYWFIRMFDKHEH